MMRSLTVNITSSANCININLTRINPNRKNDPIFPNPQPIKAFHSPLIFLMSRSLNGIIPCSSTVIISCLNAPWILATSPSLAFCKNLIACLRNLTAIFHPTCHINHFIIFIVRWRTKIGINFCLLIITHIGQRKISTPRRKN